MTQEYQHTVIGVLDPETRSSSFAYTVGLMTQNRPELLIIGPDCRAGAAILNLLSEIELPIEGEVSLGDAPLYMLPVNAAEASVEYTRLTDPKALITQVILSDTKGLFPWDNDCAEPYKSQTMLAKSILVARPTKE